jgi:putative ATPase
MDLFEESVVGDHSNNQPLAVRMRPTAVDQVLGQDHILGPGKLLRRAIEADRLNSIILYGPPGCGKTSLGEVIANATERRFERTSGVMANVAQLRTLISKARAASQGTILFIDEIHRFNKAQQDVLLPHVEDGTVTLIGATTHNPMVFINGALTSRSLIFELRRLSEDVVCDLMRNALSDERGLQGFKVEIEEKTLLHISRACEGDARRALNAMEIAVLTTDADKKGKIDITLEVAEESMQKKMVVYDRDEDGHYDTISAFIKSVRGSDPHATSYWLAKMLYAGEDPRFIARRLIILASEDIGNADPRGLTVAVSAMTAVEFVGMPEARIILSQAAMYLATAPKSNASYLAIDGALDDIKGGRVLEVPDKFKNIKVPSAEKTDQKTSDYVYPHDHDGHFVEQEYVPTSDRYYEPDGEGYEDVIRKRMERWAGCKGNQ